MKVPAEALWIGGDHPFDLHEAYLDFRRDVELPAQPLAARLFITAGSRYRLWINGTFVARGPSRSWPSAQQVDEIDVAALLRPGANAIAVQVYSPGYSHFAYVHRGACGLLAWLEVDGEVAFVTDAHWRVRRDSSWRDDVRRVSIYGSGVERRDLGRDEAWQAAAFDEGWRPPRIVAPAEGPLWRGLAPRDVPLLAYEVAPLTSVWQFRSGTSSGIDDPHEAVRRAWAGSVKDAEPREVWIAAGTCAIWVFDMGIASVCNGAAEISGALGGERLLISYAEKLRDGELVISDPATYCRMRPTDEFILRAGGQRAESFTQRGARFIVFMIEASRDVSLRVRFSARKSAYPLRVDRWPRFADPALTRIAGLCLRTLAACLQDGFVDSVWRESSQWLGDCVAQAFALAAASDDQRPLRRAITMAAAGAYDDGVLPSVLPGEVHAYAVVDYNFSWIELLAMYRGPDRAELLAAMAPVARRMLARFAADAGEDGLIRSQAGRRLFVDWSAVDRREPSLTYNGRYLYALRLAHELGIGDFRATIDALGTAMAAAFRKDGAWEENTFGTPASQLGLALALLNGIADPSEAERIVARSLDLDDGHSPGKLVLASPFMHHYVFLALERLGRRTDIVNIIRARWGRWAEAGEATCWENWNVDFPDGSTCHGFSAHPLGWLMRLAPGSG